MSIVCATDFGKDATAAGEVAARLAARRKEPLALVHALQIPSVTYIAGEPIVVAVPDFVQPTRDEMQEEADRRLDREAKRLAELSGGEVVPVLAIDSPAQAVLEIARQRNASLIVSGTRGATAPSRWILGSTADRLARRSKIPVLVIREPWSGLDSWARGERPLKVLVGVDFDDSFPVAAAAAKTLLAAGPCELHYAHVYDLPTVGFYARDSSAPVAPASRTDVEPTIAREVDRMIGEAGLPSSSGRVHLLYGRPANAISDYAASHGIDTVILGTHGRKGLERALLGSVAIGVLHHAPCPVLIAPIV